MRCQKYREWISLSLDGELPPDRAIPLEDHLEACGGCREYHEDLQLGSRLLLATRPALAENFEWRLKLKLNRTLAEAARESVLPWRERGGPWVWLRNFGLAGTAGLAAVLIFAFVVWPEVDVQSPAADQRLAAGPPPTITTDRRPIQSTWTPPDFGTRFVSSGGATGGGAVRPSSGLTRWTGSSTVDLGLLRELRAENRRLLTRLMASQREIQALKAQLDTAAIDSEHLGR